MYVYPQLCIALRGAYVAGGRVNGTSADGWGLFPTTTTLHYIAEGTNDVLTVSITSDFLR